MTTAELLGEHLAILREKAGLTLDEAAAKSKLHRRSVSKLEAGETNANLETLEAIAKAYNCTLADLFEPWAKATSPDTDILVRKLKLILEKNPKDGEGLKTVIDSMFRSLKKME